MRLRLWILLALLIAVITIFFSAFLVGRGVRTWIWWQARRQGLHIEIGRIDAPVFRPVAISKLHITDPHGNAFEVDAEQATVRLNLARILFGARGRCLRDLSMNKLHVRVSRQLSAGNQKPQINWPVLQKLLPDTFRIANFELRVEGEDSVILLHNASISASEIEAGRFSANQLMVSSSLFHQTFSNLRGATKWQDNRLTIGGITLGRGLDLQSVMVDLGHLAKQRADFQFDLDTFGGKVRASFSDEWRPAHSLWNFAGSANDISLAQTSEAFGFTDRLGGSLHAGKFTFRGDPRDATRATASIWTELTDLSWRDHAADTIMIGAVFYNRQVQLQQLYVKQRNNQLTLSGEGSLGSKPNAWLSPDFRGEISGSIKDLGQFASLFGARPGDFAGEIEIEGTMDTRDRKIGGHLTASGSGVSVFKTQIDEFTANFGLKASQLEVEQFDLSRKEDWLHAEGRIDLGDTHNYSGSLSADVHNLTDYLSIFGLTSSTDPHLTPAHFQCMIDSGIWHGNVAVAPPGSRPISVSIISLPIWIGESFDEFSIRPINLIFSFPLVFLNHSPHWLSLGILNGGILSGGMHVSGTLRNPVIDGDMQLIDGRTAAENFGFNAVSGRAIFNASHGSIDFLRLANNEIDLGFSGKIDATAADRLAISLTSDSPLTNLIGQPLNCANRITFSKTETIFAPFVSQLEFRGGLFDSAWTITLRSLPSDSFETNNIDDRTMPLCFDEIRSNTLSLDVYAPSPPAPPTHRKHGRR